MDMDYCNDCANKEICMKNHWAVTFDRYIIYNTQFVCDNFKSKDNKVGEIDGIQQR